MTNFTDIKYNYLRKIIEGKEFIRIETIDNKFGVIDVAVLCKDKNKFYMIEQCDLPKKMVDELMDVNGYTNDISVAEFYTLERYLKENIEKIKELNDTNNRISNVLKHYYIVIKEEKMFVVRPFNTNEFGTIRTKGLNMKLIPYIMCDLIENNSKYNDNVFYFDGDLFVQVSKIKDFTLLTMFYVNPQNGECKVGQMYKLRKIKDKWDISMDIKMDNIEKIIQKEVEKFIKKLES